MLVSPTLIAELTDVLRRKKFAAHAQRGTALTQADEIDSDDRYLLDVVSSDLLMITPRGLADRLGFASSG